MQWKFSQVRLPQAGEAKLIANGAMKRGTYKATDLR
jgi:hypothetical protein